VKDPCIKLCKFERDTCRGCGRTKAEIKAWKKLGKVAQRAVLAEADMRLLSLAAVRRKKR
jgi:predicted Fe-S protein YdhL (DUF1289 family)